MKLKCLSNCLDFLFFFFFAGEPTPQLSWLLDNEPFIGFMKDIGSKISSHLIIHSVSRSHNGKILECRVNVIGVSTTITQSVRLIVYGKFNQIH